MIKIKKVEELQVNDIFRFLWGTEEFIAIITSKENDEITFDDIISPDNADITRGTTVQITDSEKEFKYIDYIGTYISSSAIFLKKIRPEFFL